MNSVTGSHTESSTGLVTSKGEQVPLIGVEIEARVRDLAVHTTLIQRFRNVESKPIEAVYSFPMSEESAVCGFEARIGERLVKGRVDEREIAFEEYDEAVRAGHTAFLLDQYRPDVFLVSVGRLLPGEEALIRISHVSRAERWDRGLRLRIPTTISPRYVPAETLSKADPADLDAILPPTVMGGAPYGLALSVDIAAASAVTRVSCPSHPIEVSIRGRKAAVTLAGHDVQLDSDFVLDIELEKPAEPVCVACRDGEGYAVMVRVKPAVPSREPAPRDVIFIVDRSGSMEGTSIQEAKAALLLGLKSLRTGDRFNVIGFGTSSQQVFDRLTEYDDKSLGKAIKATSSWRADLGGTEILEPLNSALESTEKGRQACIFLLTDGQVGNETDVIALAGQYRGRCRIFSFGIGRGASGTLVKGVARATGGHAEFIYPGERIEPKVMRQMARLASAYAHGTRISWGSLQPELATPADLQAFAEDDEVTAFCRVGSLARTTVELLAGDSSTLARCELDPEQLDLVGDNTIALLMARDLIADLETGAPADTGSAQASRKDNAVDERIREIALRYQLVSSKTSFVAIELRKDPDGSEPVVLRRIPVELTREWGGAFAGFGSITHNVCANLMTSNAMAPTFLKKCIDGGGRLPKSRRKTAEKAISSVMPADPLLALVSLQRADGSWELDDELARMAGGSKKKLLAAAPDGTARAVIAGTLAALYVIWTEHVGREDEWKLIAGKALAWLEQHGIRAVEPATGRSLMEWLAEQQ